MNLFKDTNYIVLQKIIQRSVIRLGPANSWQDGLGPPRSVMRDQPSVGGNSGSQQYQLSRTSSPPMRNICQSVILRGYSIYLFVQVFESRYEIPQQERLAETARLLMQSVCLTSREYYSLVLTLIFLFVLLIASVVTTGCYYK